MPVRFFHPQGIFLMWAHDFFFLRKPIVTKSKLQNDYNLQCLHATLPIDLQ